ncbi:hypothetical protein E2562_004029 [Oryza meyeriana var. granulata]|uniref:Legume lectin domain-containing protein n=1 Tax=Oryza meyeriana var. granulata TaxID=110450 RepID=A0A6G1BJC7_9ORYZ|nr:hypothetical protein E2562_004029 [Oryza meyeriana var. granulata]
MSSSRLFLFLLCVSLLTIHPPIVSSLSFNIHFSQSGYDPGEVLFHQISRTNLSFSYPPMNLVLPYKEKKNFTPESCDCSRLDGILYARPLLLWDKATEEIASFKMTLCLRVNHEDTNSRGGHSTGLFLFLIPYPWNENGERIEVELDRNWKRREHHQSSIVSDVVCAHVSYHSQTQLLMTDIRIGDHSCLSRRKVDWRSMPKQVAVGIGSTTAGVPIKLHNILTWTFHSTFQSKDPPLMQPELPTDDESSAIDWGQQRLHFDPWNRNAELNLRFQRNWQRNWQLTCSVSVSLGYGNTNDIAD